MEWFLSNLWWIIIALGVVAIIGYGIYIAIKLKRMKPEERQAKVIEFLIGLVTVAENVFNEKGKGSEKLAWVTNEFKKNAPWFLKLISKFCGDENIESLIERALEIAKTTLFNKKDNVEDK